MAPGTIASVPLMILDWTNEFIDAGAMPTGRLIINADEVGDVLVAERKGVGRYLFSFKVPEGYPNGTKIYMHQKAFVQLYQLKRLFECGVIDDQKLLATREQLVVINDALKTVSLEAGIPHTKDLP